MRSIESMTEARRPAAKQSCKGLVHRVALPRGSRYLVAWRVGDEWETHVTHGFVGDGPIRRAPTRKGLASIATVATFASYPGACKRVRLEREARGGKLRPVS
jgi:hypothetical protein